MILRSLESFYRKIDFSPESVLWIAVSGGLDSVFLLDRTAALFRSQKILGLKQIKVLHINHGLRGSESDGDEKFVIALCNRLSIPISVHRLSWKEKESKSQAACRNKREEIYARIPRADYLALAHHADDLAETIFMRILRGTGALGIFPMQEISGNRLRPLLGSTRKQIEQEAKKIALEWREDSSNKKNKYERNWLRLEIFPQLEERRPGFSRRLISLAREVHELSSKDQENIPYVNWEGKGMLYKQSILKNLTYDKIHTLFSANRMHTTRIKDFLNRSSGKYSLAGGDFLWLSCGYVLHCKLQAPIVSSIVCISPSFSSDLGIWSSKDPSLFLRAYATGENRKWKKELIARKVPAFFRTHIPATSGAEEFLLIPKILGSPEKLKCGNIEIVYEPSLFAKSLFSVFQLQFS